MKNLFFFALTAFFLSSGALYAQKNTAKSQIYTLLDAWHQAAGKADFEEYFSYFTPNAIYIGTDAKERWTLEAFKKYVRPYFKKGHGWMFTELERHIYFSADAKVAWFDELLQTHMGLCRGSGVLKKVDGHWKIAHYVLSVAIPNSKMEQVKALKKSVGETFSAK